MAPRTSPQIRLAHLGITASVHSNGRALPVYRVETKGHRVECFIESQTDQPFEVRFGSTTGADVTAWVYLDGDRTRGHVLNGHDFQSGVIGAKSLTATTEAPFKFSKIALTDRPEEACSEEAIIKEVGSIRLAVHRIRILGDLPTRTASSSTIERKFDERSKKAELAHMTGFGASRAAPPSNYLNVSYIDPITAPMAEFVFAYRHKDLLELKGIIPVSEATPSASSSSLGKRPLRETDANAQDELTRLREENERLRAQMKAHKKVKTEGKEEKPFKNSNQVIELD